MSFELCSSVSQSLGLLSLLPCAVALVGKQWPPLRLLLRPPVAPPPDDETYAGLLGDVQGEEQSGCDDWGRLMDGMLIVRFHRERSRGRRAVRG